MGVESREVMHEVYVYNESWPMERVQSEKIWGPSTKP